MIKAHSPGIKRPLVYAMFLLCLFSLHSLAHAQFTGVPYHFEYEPPSVVQSGGDEHYCDAMAGDANGYGTWIISRTGAANLKLVWQLWGNNIEQPQLSISGPIHPSGMLDQGTYVDDGNAYNAVKVATNLDGKVRFVRVNANRTAFIVSGFNSGDVKHSFIGIPHPASTRDLITKDVRTTEVTIPTIPAGTGIYRKVIEASNLAHDSNEVESYEEDCFDIAMDKTFLYIAWCAVDTVALAPQTIKCRIYVTVVNLNTGIQQPGWPIPVTTAADGFSGTTLDEGRRVTIACNKRNADAQIKFQLAYITNIVNGQVKHLWKNNALFPGVTGGTQLLPKRVVDVTSSTTPPGTLPYAQPTHVKIAVSSVSPTPTGTYNPPAIIYIIEDNKLMAQKITGPTYNLSPAGYALYADGPHAALPPHPSPMPSGFWRVIDGPLHAFANPYDGEGGTTPDNFDEFHCLYFMRDPAVLGSVPYLMTIQSAGWNTRTPLNRTSTDQGTTWSDLSNPPITLHRVVGAANQMGIHVHYLSSIGSRHVYSRDVRRFDEDIEEHTIVTYKTIVGDGTAHAGTVGATLRSGKTMTLWTDPNWNVGVSSAFDNGIYTARSNPPGYSNAQIYMEDPNTVLQIGKDAASNGKLVTLPNFEYHFSTSSQVLKIYQNSTFEFNGVPEGLIATNFTGPGGTIKLEGGTATLTNSSTGYPSSITSPATLNIHGGAILSLPTEITFRSTSGIINLLNEPSVRYAFGTSNNNELGSIVTQGNVEIINSKINSYIANDRTSDLIEVQPCTSCYDWITQFSMKRTLVQNLPPSGQTGNTGNLRITFTGTLDAYNGIGSVLFQGGKLDRTSIYAEEAGVHLTGNTSENGFDVLDVEFDNILSTPIKITRDAITDLDYDNVLISSNTFKTFLNSGVNMNGVSIENYKRTSRRDFVSIYSNLFTTNTGQTSTNPIENAVLLNRSCGVINYNTISGAGFKNGITNNNTISGSTDVSTSLICSNTIENTYNYGLWTDWWSGYGKLNSIANGNIGHNSGDNDVAKLIANHYYNNDGPGLKLGNSVDMAGVPNHTENGVAVSGYPAMNTIEHNNLDLNSNSGQIHVTTNGADLWLSRVRNPNSSIEVDSPHVGKNNIIANNDVTNGTDDNFIWGPYGPNNSTTVLKIGSMHRQYWAAGSPEAVYYVTGSTTGRFDGMVYENWTGWHVHQPTSAYTASGIACGNGTPEQKAPQPNSSDSPVKAKTENLAPSANEKPSSMDDLGDCERLYNHGYDLATFEPLKGYDTLKHYIETCAQAEGSYHAFNTLNGAVSTMTDDKMKYPRYRDWLLSVLYLNTVEPRYYCSDVQSIITTFQFVPGRGYDVNGTLAVYKYLLETNRCPTITNYIKDGWWNGGRAEQYKHWQDTVKVDTNLFKLDTTLPSLEELGLGILRENPNAGIKPAHELTYTLGDITASSNPFTTETNISLEMLQLGLVKFELYNELGQVVQHNDIGRVVEKGKHIIPIDGSSLSTGTYYARFSTSGGETKTLKLKHIK